MVRSRLADYADRGFVRQSDRPAAIRGVARLALLIAVAMGTAGCGLSSITSGIGGGIFGQQKSDADVPRVTEEQLMSAAKADPRSPPAALASGDVAHGCPRFVVASRDRDLTIFETGKVGDALAVMHRGEITKTARECQIEAGRVTVKYGFSGQVLLGPRGRPGPVMLPVAVSVLDAKRERVAADKAQVEVMVASDRPIGYFSIVKTVSFTVPEGARPGEFVIQVGFERNIPGAG